MAKGRMAGMALDALKWLFKGDDAGQIAMRVIPDVGFGVLEGAMTPGDFADKLVAGTATATGSMGGGLLLGKLGGKSAAARQLLDMAGSVGGDFGGRAVGDTIQRGKDKLMGGEGLTAYERMSEDQFRAMKEEASRQVLAEFGLLPAGYQSALHDPTTGMGVN